MSDTVFEVFYDGDCPLCLKEINMIRWMDRKNRILFTDIASETFSPGSIGRSMPELMDQIHGRLPDGSMVIGVDVFRHLYSAVGFGPVVAFTRLPVVTQALDVGYMFFAKHRLRLTGRCSDGTCGIEPSKQTIS
jgi:predicted DCC family thiol-disulfide oxidoreductase YuxK